MAVDVWQTGVSDTAINSVAGAVPDFYADGGAATIPLCHCCCLSQQQGNVSVSSMFLFTACHLEGSLESQRCVAPSWAGPFSCKADKGPDAALFKTDAVQGLTWAKGLDWYLRSC